MPSTETGALGSCGSSAASQVALTISPSAALTQGHLYGLVVSAASFEANGFDELVLCTGPTAIADPAMVDVNGAPPITGVPQFPFGTVVMLGVAMAVLILLRGSRLSKVRIV